MHNEIFEQIQTEVKDMIEKIETACKDDKEFNDLYKGVQVYFSPIVEKPGFMFMGINPGAGNAKNNSGVIPHDYAPLQKHSYISDEYTLADNWKYIFQNDFNRIDLLEKSFKSNCYFISTTNETDLNKLKRIISKYIGNEFEVKSKEWTTKIIEAVHPKVLICEGVATYNQIKSIFLDEEFESNSDYKLHTTLKRLDIDIVGFERIYSNFKSEDAIVSYIPPLIKYHKL